MSRPKGMPMSENRKKQNSLTMKALWASGEFNRKQVKLSEEEREAKSVAHKKWIKENGHPMKGTIKTESHRLNQSKALKNIPWSYERWEVEIPKIIVRAIRHEFLGKKPTPYVQEWHEIRRSIYKRDKFICQECNTGLSRKTGIACHHIDYDKHNNDSMNLITLCSRCHCKTNHSRDEWTVYFQDKMMLKIKEQSNV